MAFVSWLIMGLFAGVVARLLMPGRQKLGLLWTLLLGVAGSFLGGLFATRVLNIADDDQLDFGSFAIAVIASFVLLGIYMRVDRMLPDRKRDEKTEPSV